MSARTTVFVVGAPRSGTTLAQHLIGAHRLVATSQETDLFDHYVAPLRAQWEQQLPADPELWQRNRHKGLPAVLTEAQFDALVGDVIERVHATTMELKPGAQVLLEKVPGYGRHAELILRYLPDARFIHVVRDGRDVTCSLMRAGRGWGRSWAPSNAADAAALWRDHVIESSAIRRLTSNYTEVRYEDLCGPGGPDETRRLLQFCGAEATLEEAARIHGAAASGASALLWGGAVLERRGCAPSEPDGFAGEGGVATWQRELSRRDRVLVDRVAGAALAELGYATPGWTQVGRLGASLRLFSHRQVDRARYHAARIAEGAR